MVPPLGVFAAWTYYRQGYVDIKTAVLICLGFLAGSILGADLALLPPRGSPDADLQCDSGRHRIENAAFGMTGEASRACNRTGPAPNKKSDRLPGGFGHDA